MMLQSARELWLAFLAILLISTLYLLTSVQMGGIPPAREFFGHSLGILGFLLMLMTEILYSMRKRSRRARWGRMSAWLQFHIFTGIVGPFLVFLHTSFKFNGLAGVVMLFTAIVVLSGFIGRYIYTALPRSADGALLESDDLEQMIEETEDDIDRWVAGHPATGEALLAELQKLAGHQPAGTAATILLRAPRDWLDAFSWWRLRRRFSEDARAPLIQLETAFRRRRALLQQIAILATARRMLGLWHTIHVPLGVVLFTTAMVHIVAAVYYATLLR